MKQGILVAMLAMAMSSFPVLASESEVESPEKTLIEKIVEFVLQNDPQDAKYSQPPAPGATRNDFSPPPDKGGGGFFPGGGLCWAQGATIICQNK